MPRLPTFEYPGFHAYPHLGTQLSRVSRLSTFVYKKTFPVEYAQLPSRHWRERMDLKKWHPCQSCGKTLSSYKSLWRHRKNCKHTGHGLTSNQHASSDKFSAKRNEELEKVGHEVDDDAEKVLEDLIIDTDRHQSTETSESNDENSEDESMESNESDDNEDSDESEGSDVDTDDALWRSLIKISSNINETVFNTLASTFYLYKSSDGELFQKILRDVEYAKNSLYFAESKSINYALRKNKDSILEMMNNCDKHRGNDLWCSLLDTKPGCRVLTGENCACCDGYGVLDRLRPILEIYYGMRHDDLMQNIDKAVDARIINNKETLKEAIGNVFAQYKEKILETVELMSDTIDEDEWARHKKGKKDAATYNEHKCT